LSKSYDRYWLCQLLIVGRVPFIASGERWPGSNPIEILGPHLFKIGSKATFGYEIEDTVPRIFKLVRHIDG
jgi:hypothetical protein